VPSSILKEEIAFLNFQPLVWVIYPPKAGVDDENNNNNHSNRTLKPLCGPGVHHCYVTMVLTHCL